MNEIKHIKLPLSDEDAQALRAGDIVRLSGSILVGRDAAHKRMAEAIREGGEPPFPIENEIIYYAGPAPTPPGAVIGPDTLARAARLGLDARGRLDDNDAHAFFARLGAQVLTGPTHTNVNDFRATLVV